MSSRATTEPAGPVPLQSPARLWFSLGRLGPAVLAGWLTLDLGLRLLPVERLGVSPIAAAQRFSGRYSPFVANVSITLPAGSPGENAVRGNLQPTERRAVPLRFSTNRLGYRRNPEARATEIADVLIFGGDSFIYGANLSDEETLPAALTRASGLQVFNGGRSHLFPMRLRDVDWLLSHFPRRPRQAVFVHLEQHRRSLLEDSPSSSERFDDDLRYTRWLVTGWLGTSPLSNATRRLFRRLADGKVLPNAYAENVVAYALPDGLPMLFRPSETFPARKPQDEATIAKTAEYIVEWARELQTRGLETQVLLLPTRFTLYGPWLEQGELRPGVFRAAQDLRDLEAQLRQRGIRTINALRVFQSTVVDDLRTGALPYYREDNHWNPDGVRRIARVLADSLVPERPVARVGPLAAAAPTR